jgi:O-antigen ligase
MVFALLGPVGFFAPAFLWVLPLIQIVTHRRAIAAEIKDQKFALLWKNSFMFILPLYGLVSAAWSINPQDSVATSLKVFSFITLGAILIGVVRQNTTQAMRRNMFTWVAYGLIATELVILAELALGGQIYMLLGHENFSDIVYSRGAVIVALTLIPVAVALARHMNWMLLAAFVTLGLATIFLLSNESAMLLVGVSGIVYALVWWKKRLFWAILTLPLLFILVVPALNLIKLDAADLCAIKAVKSTAAHRIIIWQFTSKMTMRKPITGWGMDSARSIPGGSDVVSIANCYDPSLNQMVNYVGERLPLHPHNSAFQLWLELGAVGVLIALFAMIHQLRRAHGRNAAARGDSPLIAAVFSSCFLVYSISSGIWQSWLIFACIILFMLTALSGGPRDAAHE